MKNLVEEKKLNKITRTKSFNFETSKKVKHKKHPLTEAFQINFLKGNMNQETKLTNYLRGGNIKFQMLDSIAKHKDCPSVPV